jgi:hypothetical protein
MCDCQEAVNKRLAFSNAKIAFGLMWTADANPRVDVMPPTIVLEKIDKSKRGKLPTLMASCCPFCGERYPE